MPAGTAVTCALPRKPFAVEPRMPMPLPPSFFDDDPVAVARSLLGATLTRRQGGALLRARVVETEAYDGPADPACDRVLRSSAALAAMGGPPGRYYMHRSYGVPLLNVVCRPAGEAAAVLVRAAEPLEGLDLMRARRPGARADRDLLRGPANLSRALGLGVDLTGRAVDDEALSFEAGPPPRGGVAASPRIGLSAGVDLPWRFFFVDDPFVSGPRLR
ncbi:MAG TPA: DNA-3-methyladenine glycosylase [Polyangiaceae bacterium]|nr:DNA-3-methyladenine glycosylase [Polyangiaceae bacterium]